jgi:hypothetical protein
VPDLNQRFDYGAVLDAVEQPLYEEIERRGRRLRRRRAAFATTGLAVLIMLASVTIPTLRNPGPQPDAGAASDLLGPQLQFVTPKHGYATFASAPQPDATTCALGVRETTDGGQTWSEMRDAPCVPADREVPPRFRPSPQAIGGETLIIRVNDKKHHLSRDAGRTWSEYQPRVRTAETFPDGVRPHRVCKEGTAECANDNRLEWWDPATGDLVRLAKGPEMGALRGTVVATDGSLWVAGYSRDRQWAVAVTRDNGRTWVTRVMGLKGDLEGPVVTTWNGHLGYLVAAGAGVDSAGKRYEYSIFRTNDGGGTWRRVDTQKIPAKYFGIFDALVGPDGTLFIPDSDGPWYASRNGGETFTVAKDFPKFEPQCVPGLCYGTTGSGYASEDLLTWRKLQTP